MTQPKILGMPALQWVGLLLAAVLLSAWALWLFNNPRQTKGQKVQFVAFLSLTGPAAQFDAIKRRSLETAFARLSKTQPNLSLEIQDAGASPEVLVAAARQAVAGGARILFSGTSPNALAIAAVARKSGVQLVQLANAANPEFGPPRPLEYRLWPDWQQEAAIIHKMLKSASANTALLISSADPYSTSLDESLRNAAPKITFTSLRFDPASPPDFRPAILKAKAANIDAVVIFGLPPSLKALTTQLQEVDWKRPVLGGVNLNLSQEHLQQIAFQAPVFAVRTTTMRPTLDPASEAGRFREDYKLKYGDAPPFHSIYAADAAYMSAAAMGRSNNDEPQSGFRSLKRFESASGQIDVNASGVLDFELFSEQLR
jgi:ABC-type branched-subunit amino acid transport system substrate-binding protein